MTKADPMRLHLLVRPHSADHVAETACAMRGEFHQHPGTTSWITTSTGKLWVTVDPAEVNCQRCLRKMRK